jgi:hypothetical protein
MVNSFPDLRASGEIVDSFDFLLDSAGCDTVPRSLTNDPHKIVTGSDQEDMSVISRG